MNKEEREFLGGLRAEFTEIHEELHKIIRTQEKLMADFTKLTAAQQALDATVATLTTAVTGLSTADQPQIDAATAAITTTTGNLNAIVTGLTPPATPAA